MQDGYIRIDHKQPSPPTVTMSQREFDNLAEYSLSFPTGKTIGRKWKAKSIVSGLIVWYRCEYVDVSSKKFIGIRWRTIQILEVDDG